MYNYYTIWRYSHSAKLSWIQGLGSTVQFPGAAHTRRLLPKVDMFTATFQTLLQSEVVCKMQRNLILSKCFFFRVNDAASIASMVSVSSKLNKQ